MSFPRGFAFELTIEGIRDVYGCSHTAMLPYLWLVDKGPRGAGNDAAWLTRWAGRAGDPSLRL